MRRRDLLAPAVLALGAACAKKAPKSARTVRVGVTNYASMSPLYVAMERGFDREAGIVFQPMPITRPGDAVALLASNGLDAALTFLTAPVMNAAAKGTEVRAVLVREIIHPSCGDAGNLYLRAKSVTGDPSDARQWIGKKIWCGQGASLAEYLLDTAIERAGLNAAEVPRPPLNFTQAAAALTSGAIDGILSAGNLAVDFSQHREILRVDAIRKQFIGLQISHIVFGPSLVKGDVALGGAVLSSFLRGVREFQAGATPKFLADLVAAQGKLTDECRSYFSAGGAIDLKGLQPQVDWAIRRGYVPAGVTAEMLVDSRFLEAARRRG